MEGMDGLELMRAVREIDPDIPVILVTGHGDVADGGRRIERRRVRFPRQAVLDRPADRRGAPRASGARADPRQPAPASQRGRRDDPVGNRGGMAELRTTVGQMAMIDLDVLLEGETGTGKELVAHMLHRQSRRSAAPLVAVNCAALPHELAEGELFGSDLVDRATGKLGHAGRIRSAHRGTLFLDEIDTMHPAVQAKLLRVIEEREVQPIGAAAPEPVDLRVVAATKTDLMDAVRVGDFREDLDHRLHVVKLRIPPLRERRTDIPQTFAYFLDEARQIGLAGFRIDDSVRRYLVEHDWPGNVRELKNFAYSVVLDLARGSPIGSHAGGRDAGRAGAPLRSNDPSRHIVQTRGNIAEAMMRTQRAAQDALRQNATAPDRSSTISGLR